MEADIGATSESVNHLNLIFEIHTKIPCFRFQQVLRYERRKCNFPPPIMENLTDRQTDRPTDRSTYQQKGAHRLVPIPSALPLPFPSPPSIADIGVSCRNQFIGPKADV